MVIVVNQIPPSDNKFKGRRNVWEYRTAKKEWLDMLLWLCKGKVPQKPFERAVVTITYFFPTRGRRDPDNYSGKFILDGLVQAGIIQDDSFRCIDLRLRGDCDREKPRTEIEIMEEKHGEEET